MTRRGRGLPVRVADAIADPDAWEQLRKLKGLKKISSEEVKSN